MSFSEEKVPIKTPAGLSRALLAVIQVFCFVNFQTYSERYKISDVTYALEKTRERDLRRTVSIDTERIFEDRDELDEYLSDLNQRLLNTRAFQSVEIKDSSLSESKADSESDSTEITQLSIHIDAKDTRHLLILPYPKYDSNDGLIFKIKVKDVNFLGTMNTLDAGVFAGLKEDTSTGNQNLTFGAEFKYSYPFQVGPFICSWNNSLDAVYTHGVNELEFWTGTGFTFELPFQRFSLVLTASEEANRDLEYEALKDEQYFTSDINLSLPVKILDIENWGYVFWTPFTEGKVSYDRDKINIDNDDLASPVLSIGQSVSTERINWYGNFRNGLSLKIGHSMGYDFQQEETEPKIYGELQGFKAFSHIALNTRFTFFHTNSNREYVGNLIRGVRDKQLYVTGKDLFTYRALKAPSAIAINIDIPIHVITTDWLSWSEAIFGEDSWFSRCFAWTGKFNFELQMSPFMDFALTKNEATGRLFSLKDGWYTGGLEFLVFPENWKGIVLRASLGIDMGRALIAKKYPEKLDMSWREDIKKYEIFAGIGLHY